MGVKCSLANTHAHWRGRGWALQEGSIEERVDIKRREEASEGGNEEKNRKRESIDGKRHRAIKLEMRKREKRERREGKRDCVYGSEREKEREN